MRYLFDEGGSSQPPLVFERKECPFLHCKEFFSPCRVGRCGITHTSRDGRRWMKRKNSTIGESLVFGWCAGRVVTRGSPYRPRDDKNSCFQGYPCIYVDVSTPTTTTNSSAHHSLIPSVGKAETGGSIHGLQRDSMVGYMNGEGIHEFLGYMSRNAIRCEGGGKLRQGHTGIGKGNSFEHVSSGNGVPAKGHRQALGFDNVENGTATLHTSGAPIWCGLKRPKGLWHEGQQGRCEWQMLWATESDQKHW
ncbi:hypothetical protein PCH_Pc16g14750 [Penicillium rubens Wisconsin 54-1255]|uniref:Uncharacterized protein n=1 Tax=Penicillium rubens (strain ATCC 28089 / DSM 1075 / NRRL 1951 / Wisconsin 54-1255) TaxID=500485 RepID=B6HA21_PENRW|nr:hypothetical protein PCH_Pc16g14750 [Penicillium rubens Wisconsin 54-1255]